MKQIYGYHQFGDYFAVRLRCKLSPAEADAIASAYPTLVLRDTYTGYIMIEGILSYVQYMGFYPQLQKARLASKIYFLQAELERMHGDVDQEPFFMPDNDELPF